MVFRLAVMQDLPQLNRESDDIGIRRAVICGTICWRLYCLNRQDFV